MYDELKFIKIDENISYISPTENPLSANVVIIQCENDIWLYDVGSHPDIPAMIDDKVDLPEPLVPNIPTISPLSIEKLTFFKA